ncbi:MAG: PKD domain-containing protein [Crocinitomicaceae bacterium]|nr:PKD domain-containing protein [Crocinitomicaceae bacterium]
MKKTLIALFTLSSLVLFGQTKKVLFLGNSYTYVNNMPQIVSDLANSKGKTLVFDSNTIGGYRLLNHSSDATSLAKIASNDWDYVVIQGQSQEGAFPDGQLASEVYPHAAILNDSVKSNNACSESMFFMTWGRENGDASNCGFYPPFCTYDGMQSRLKYAYKNMADQNDGSVAPVGEAWRYLRTNYPLIDLYNADESHPSPAGSYLAACVFYVSIFRESITGSTYLGGLPQADATIIQDVASMTVLDSLDQWNIGAYDAQADFTFSGTGMTVDFVNASTNGTDYYWDFGDMNNTTTSDPSHTYSATGTYNVMLVANNGCTADTTYQNVDLASLSVDENSMEIKIWNDANQIRIFSDFQIESYTIVSMNGSKVKEGRIVGNTLNIDQLEKGIYLLRLKTLKGDSNIRFIK